MDYQEKTLRVLRASDGHWLTLKEGDAEGLVAKIIYLAVNDSPERYKEVSDQEAEEIRAAYREKIERQVAATEKEQERQRLEARLAELQKSGEA